MSKHDDHHDHDHHDHAHGHDHGHAPARRAAKGHSHDHGHGHDHAHGHGHHHHGDPNTMGRAFAIAIVLNLAFVGILVNGFSAWLFMSGSKDDINIRGAYLHMAADAAISLGVLVAGVIVRYSCLLYTSPSPRDS